MNYEPITILTAELPTIDFHSNYERTCKMRLELIEMGLSFIGIKINDLTGFIVESGDHDRLKLLAKSYNQEFVVYLDEKRCTHKISCIEPYPIISLGALLKCTKDVRMGLGEVKITFIENGMQHVYSTEQ